MHKLTNKASQILLSLFGYLVTANSFLVLRHIRSNGEWHKQTDAFVGETGQYIITLLDYVQLIACNQLQVMKCLLPMVCSAEVRKRCA
jgi:hypothetical protein